MQSEHEKAPETPPPEEHEQDPEPRDEEKGLDHFFRNILLEIRDDANQM